MYVHNYSTEKRVIGTRRGEGVRMPFVSSSVMMLLDEREGWCASFWSRHRLRRPEIVGDKLPKLVRGLDVVFADIMGEAIDPFDMVMRSGDIERVVASTN